MRTRKEAAGDRGESVEILTEEGVCLRAVDYGEKDKILTLYLAGYGKIGVSAKGCKSAKSKLKYAVTPLCFGKYYLTKKNNYVLTGCDCIDSFFSLTSDPLKYYCASAVIEVVDKMTMEDEYNHRLFVTMLNALNEICYKAEYPKVCLFDYLKELGSALGYQINAITFKDFYNYFYHTHGVKINSIAQLIKFDSIQNG